MEAMKRSHHVVALSNKACNIARVSLSRVVSVKFNKGDAGKRFGRRDPVLEVQTSQPTDKVTEEHHLWHYGRHG